VLLEGGEVRRVHAVRVALAALGVLAVVSAGEARQHKPPRSHAGDFDFYLLSMSIAPSFCALSPANRSKPDCRHLTADTFQQTPLTIHGLWPNRAHVSVNKQPSQCTQDALRLSDAVKTDLARYMPGGPDLEQHEWSRHGTCSGLSPDDYFAAAVGLARQRRGQGSRACRRNRRRLPAAVRRRGSRDGPPGR
jgi:ribonuclease T2